MRMFVAVEIPAAVQSRLAALCDSLAEQLAGARPPRSLRWSGGGKYHITLRFLGETTPEQQNSLAPLLSEAGAATAPFALEAGGLGAFPNWPKLRVLWAGVDGDMGELRGLQRRVEEAARQVGFGAEKQSFNPHVTLARADREGGPAALTPADLAWVEETKLAHALGQWEVDELVLMESELHPSGSVYTVRGRYPLLGKK